MGTTSHYGMPGHSLRDQLDGYEGLDARARRESLERADLARRIEAAGRQAGREAPSFPSNFLPPDQRTTTTTSAGTSLYSTVDVTHADAHSERLRAAQAIRESAAAQRLSGSHEHVHHTGTSWYAEQLGQRSARPLDWSDTGDI